MPEFWRVLLKCSYGKSKLQFPNEIIFLVSSYTISQWFIVFLLDGNLYLGFDLFHNRHLKIVCCCCCFDFFFFPENKYKYFRCKWKQKHKIVARNVARSTSTYLGWLYPFDLQAGWWFSSSICSVSSEYRMRPLQIWHANQRLPFSQFVSLVIELLMVLHIPLIKVYGFILSKGAICNVESFKNKMFYIALLLTKLNLAHR